MANRPHIASLVLFFTLTGHFSSSCKVRREASNVQSLTADEEKLCKFEGKRFMLLFSNDFIEDANGAQDLFSFSSPTYFIDENYSAANHNTDRLESCLSQLKKLGRYEIYVDKRGKGATWASFQQRMLELKSEIRNLREENATQEIQILLSISSHGAPLAASSTIVFSDRRVTYNEFINLVYETTITNCLTADCSQLRSGTTQMANEVIVLMDNCYSGNLIADMGSFFSSKIGYNKTDKIADTSSKKTRLLAFSASAPGQTATGEIPSERGEKFNGLGTLIFGLQQILPPTWLGDRNRDGRVSLKEIEQFIVNDLPGALIVGAAETTKTLAANLICGDAKARLETYQEARSSGGNAELYFGQPLKYITEQDVPGKIQKPTAYSNMTDALMNQLAVAVTSKTKEASHITATAKAYYADLQNNLKSSRTRIQAFVTISALAMKKLETSPNLVRPGTATNSSDSGSPTGPIKINTPPVFDQPISENSSISINNGAQKFVPSENSPAPSTPAKVRVPVLTSDLLGITDNKDLMPYYVEICNLEETDKGSTVKPVENNPTNQ